MVRSTVTQYVTVGLLPLLTPRRIISRSSLHSALWRCDKIEKEGKSHLPDGNDDNNDNNIIPRSKLWHLQGLFSLAELFGCVLYIYSVVPITITGQCTLLSVDYVTVVCTEYREYLPSHRWSF